MKYSLKAIYIFVLALKTNIGVEPNRKPGYVTISLDISADHESEYIEKGTVEGSRVIPYRKYYLTNRWQR